MTPPKIPPCPRCRRIGVVQGDLYYCRNCNGLYDDDPHEGGTCSNRPDRSLERKEAYEQSRKRGRCR